MQGRDLNPRPPGYEPDELPDCSTLRQDVGKKWWARRDLNPHTHLRAMDFKSIVSAIPPLARGKEALNSSEFSKPYCNRSLRICQVFFQIYSVIVGARFLRPLANAGWKPQTGQIELIVGRDSYLDTETSILENLQKPKIGFDG